MKQEKIDRINELAIKQKSIGLTEEEKKEQADLRKEYLEAIRESMRANLNNISIIEKDGSVTDLGKKFGGEKDE
jgi:UPF0291 protein CBFG_05335